MIIYNTTYHVDEEVNSNFLIWINECYIEQVKADGTLTSPKLMKVLSHNDEGHTYSLQWNVENSEALHRWYMGQGKKMIDEISKVFKDKVMMFTTLLEEI